MIGSTYHDDSDFQSCFPETFSIDSLGAFANVSRRTWRANVSTCEGTWSVQPTHDCPSGVGLPLCPGRYLPDGVHACSDPEVLTPTYQIPTLTIGGSPDDVMRVSRIAETWYTQQGSSMHQVALVEGMNHGDVMDIIHDAVNQMDLPSEIGSEATRAAVADLIVGFAAGSVAFQTEALDATFSPFVDVFVKQEGGWWCRLRSFTQLGNGSHHLRVVPAFRAWHGNAHESGRSSLEWEVRRDVSVHGSSCGTYRDVLRSPYDRKHHRCHCSRHGHVHCVGRLHQLCDSNVQRECLRRDAVWWWEFHSRPTPVRFLSVTQDRNWVRG